MKFSNLVGREFGNWYVLRYSSRPGFWLCKCVCGIQKEIRGSNLVNGKSKSCGCLRSSLVSKSKTKHGLAPRRGQALEYVLYCSAKARAKRDNVPFTLELSDIVIPEYCPVFSNVKLETKKGKLGPQYNSPSLDRLIPSKGYTKENVRVISYYANTIKQNASWDEIQRVASWLRTELNDD